MPEQNGWIQDAKSSGWWDSAVDLSNYREDCQHDLSEVPHRPIYNDMCQELTNAIAQLDARIKELTPA